jgi:8-hydroxy-5-deazaflavin:NADPH oxidoreductase
MWDSFQRLALGLVVLAAVAMAESASAETIAIIGTGRVAAALGPRFAALGHDVVYGSRDPSRPEVRELVTDTGAKASAAVPQDAARRATIVVLAVPGLAVEEVVQSLGNLAGKIVIDPTNPTRSNEDGLVEHAVATSNAEIIQKLVPSARVVKAFNTLSAQTMANPASAGGPVTIPLVGDDAAAKQAVAKLVEGIGFEALDLGPVRYAHVVEGMLVVWINARVDGRPFDYYLRRTPQRN